MAVFNLLFERETVSRVELGKELGLSRMAMSDVTSEMMNSRIVREIGMDQRSGRGKRSTLLAVDDTYWRVISVDLSEAYLIKGVLVDLSGHVVERVELPKHPEDVLDRSDVIEVCHRLAALIKPGIQEALGVGITLPGIIDTKGHVIKSVFLGWDNVNLQEEIEAAVGLPTVVGNVTNSALVAERFLGESSENSMLISLKRGVGASLCINDRIVHGDSFTTGEIGHVVVDPDGPECECGKKGCLEALVSPERIRHLIAESPLTRTQILSQSGQVLGRVLSMAVGLLDLHDICVYGPADIVGAAFLGSMREELHSMIDTEWRKIPPIRRCVQGEDLALRGQAVMVIRKLVPKIRQIVTQEDLDTAAEQY
ncbi:ROK family protein [Alloscardovia criceti]|uniref:ROK family protein n=1 Tax=Alloscardovia criceti TaxID=356828 RepID=UPI00036EB085|nr:ROK family protein [Alloscardovia criceti]